MPRATAIGGLPDDLESKEKGAIAGEDDCTRSGPLRNSLHRMQALVARHVIPKGDVEWAKSFSDWSRGAGLSARIGHRRSNTGTFRLGPAPISSVPN